MKERESNFEILRIIAMLLVVFLHCNYFVLGGVNSTEINNRPIEAFIRMFTDQLCTPCVDIFILISGWFGIKPKFKGGLSILFQVLFYTVICLLICHLLHWEITFDKIKAALTCQFAYWFIWPYLILYITAPAFNQLIDNAPKKALKIVITLLCFEFLLDWMVYYAGGGGGKSYISFVTLYLIGRLLATQNFKFKEWDKSTFLSLFLIFSLIPTLLAYYGEIYLHFQFGKSAYTNPFVIGASIALLLYFSKLKIRSKLINWVAVSSFSIYLLHMNPLIAKHFKEGLLSVYQCVNGGGICQRRL